MDLLEELPQEMTFSLSYQGARYELTECTDFSQEQMVPSGVKDPFGRFAGRKVRRWFDSTNPKERHKMTTSEGVVVSTTHRKLLFGSGIRDSIGKWMWRMWICLPWRTF